MRCDYYNRTKCEATGESCGDKPESCRTPDGNDRPTLCYALWQNSSDRGLVTEFKGCWVGSAKDCAHRSNCIENRRETKKHLFFCCCEGDLCNLNITHIPSPDYNNITGIKGPDEPLEWPGPDTPSLALITIVPLLSLIALLVAGYSFHSYRKKSRTNEVPTSTDFLIGSCPPSPYVGLRPIQLIEVKAQGKFGHVWKAKDGSDNLVAVKIFSVNDRSSWQIEQEVYRLPQMKHKNILTYLGAEKRDEGFDSQYWLITEYHYHGSLWDYLKANTVDWNQLLKIAQGIARGLTHLHEEIPASNGMPLKPSIAHRDFKSKNVLLNKDLNPCVSDFGLALIFYPGTTDGDSHSQIGTRRYMAPEILEGSITFGRDSWIRMDMYACALVLWELLSRCQTHDTIPGEYQCPYEEELGREPIIEELQEHVAQSRRRPLFKDQWLKHDGMRALCRTIEECWDPDSEARLSAPCVDERIGALIGHDFIVSI
jgi:hypothetical protein